MNHGVFCLMVAMSMVCSAGTVPLSGPVREAEFSPDSSIPARKPLRGIDFWKQDAMHVPESPVRNLMPNPSFRQGMRYYFRMWGGNFYKDPVRAPRYEIVPGGRRPDAKSLLIRTGEQTVPGNERPADMMSLPIPLEPGKDYVLSCYAKCDVPEGMLLTLCLTDNGKNFSYRTPYEKESHFPLTTEWKRYVYRFKILKKGPECVNINGNNLPPHGTILVTDVQLEEGTEPSEFVAPEKEGLLLTSSPSNTIDSTRKISARFELFGSAEGTVELSLFDFWRKKRWTGSYAMNPVRTIELPFDQLSLGKGSFCLQAKYHSKGKVWYDYYRFSVIDPILNQQSATRHFFGTLLENRMFNRNASYRQLARAGFGNYTYGCYDIQQAEAIKRYGLLNQTSPLVGVHQLHNDAVDPEFRRNLGWLKNLFQLKTITSEDEKRIEKTAYQLAKAMPQEKRWSFANEAECHTPILKEKRYAEWGRAAIAAYRGIKRANPENEFFVETGTSCYLPDRGYEVTEEHIKSGFRNKIQWDFIGLHPYSVLDGARHFSKQYMLDDTVSHIFDVLRKYNYPESTPIYVTESFNIIHQNVAEWSCGGGADTYPIGVKASYDFSREEVSQAAWAARTYLLLLKFWPRIRMVHIWRNVLWHDITLNMIPLANAVNTLRVLFPDPEFIASFRPGAGVHAYLYRGKDGRTIAALWTSREEVELHRTEGVRFEFTLNAENPKLIDLMGNEHPVHRNSDNRMALMLNAAPLFLIVDNQEADELQRALKQADMTVSATSCHVGVRVRKDGALVADLKNLERKECQFSSQDNSILLKAYGKNSMELMRRKPEFGKLFRYGFEYRYRYPQLPEIRQRRNMVWMFVPYTKNNPDWRKIPAVEVPHHVWGWKAPKEDFSAKCQLAWNEENLFVRVRIRDSQFIAPKDYDALVRNGMVWKMDNGMELYLDYDGKGKRSNTTKWEKNYYRYDFSYGNPEGRSGRGFVYRRQEPDMQLTGGTDTPSKEEAAEKIRCHFERNPKGCLYTITLPLRYLAPMKLAEGTHAGFAISLIDYDSRNGVQTEKRLALTESGLPNERMGAWASIVLMK